MDQINSLSEDLMPYIIAYGLNVIFAILILVVGWVVANWAKGKIIKKGRASEKLDDTLTLLFGKVTKILILIVVIMAVLGQFGVQTASFVAVLGALGLAVGLAWQGVLADFAAGMMILILRPFKVGDAVDIAGTSGVVQEIGIIITKLNTFDNVAMTLPNSNVWGNNIKNMSENDTRRVDMVIGFGYDDDIDEAMRVVNEVLAEDDRVLEDPAPQIAVSELGGSSVNIIVRPWTKKENYWPLKFDLTKRIKERFDEEDISFPFPQRDVHLFQEKD
jgi:small conductance mechanosensitive channel